MKHLFLVLAILSTPAFAGGPDVDLKGAMSKEVDAMELDKDSQEQNEDIWAEDKDSVVFKTQEVSKNVSQDEDVALDKNIDQMTDKEIDSKIEKVQIKGEKLTKEEEGYCENQKKIFGKSKWEKAKKDFANYDVLMGISNTIGAGACMTYDAVYAHPREAAHNVVDGVADVGVATTKVVKKSASAIAEAGNKSKEKHEDQFSLVPEFVRNAR